MRTRGSLGVPRVRLDLRGVASWQFRGAGKETEQLSGHQRDKEHQNSELSGLHGTNAMQIISFFLVSTDIRDRRKDRLTSKDDFRSLAELQNCDVLSLLRAT